MVQTDGGLMWALATYPDATRPYGFGRRYSHQTIYVAARGTDDEKLFTLEQRVEYAQYLKARSDKWGTRVPGEPFFAKDLPEQAVRDLFQPSAVQIQEPDQAVQQA